MKVLHIVIFFLFFPVIAFAESEFSFIKPFVGYNISLASNSHTKVNQNGQRISKSTGFAFNSDNVGDFIFGIEIDDVMNIGIDPKIKTIKTKSVSGETVTEKMNSIEAQAEIYVIRGSNFKPFVSFGGGYASISGSYKTSGATFSLGIGCRQYLNKNMYVVANLNYGVYLNKNMYVVANLNYGVSTEMKIKEVDGNPVSDVGMLISGYDFLIGAGYRF